ncbi:Jerky protein-like-like [Holothuria leucospilota]|uniref:Jerky protein-like-like n=1 Tax=Holothuria leucospilota TaxID=206669 RepID=A0A9Q1CT71_HOLLE|nr:Jerky protein-like-like [Holothuria leucospilota]
MVRSYKRGNGKRKYAQYDEDDVKAAIDAVKDGMSQAEASRRFSIPRGTLQNKIKETHSKKVGRPTVLSQDEESVIVMTLAEVAKWGYPMTHEEIKMTIKMYLDKQGRKEGRFKNNLPGDEFIRSFVLRNQLSYRSPGNIKRARAKVGVEELNNFFKNVREVLVDTEPANIFNFDETNITDDPGLKRVLVPRGIGRVERVQEHSKSISIMACGSATGLLLPPFVVYKAQNIYENWTKNGPSGSKYAATKNGWFDRNTFERWFFEIFLPTVSSTPGKKVLIGDNLASHFSVEVVQAAICSDVYFTALPPNTTHLTQPLDIAVFRPMKVMWKRILDEWRNESRRQGTLPKEVFPSLLAKLWEDVSHVVEKNLQSGFRKAGLCPFNPEEVLKIIPDAVTSTEENVGRILDQSLITLLQQNRGRNDQQKPRRGRKFQPGVAITVADCSPNLDPSKKIPDQQPSTSGVCNPSEVVSDDDDNKCANCSEEFDTYTGPEWLQCVYCLKWVCGHCNGGFYDPSFCCSVCN